MSNQLPEQEGGLFTALAVFIIVTALEAFGLNWVWNHVVTVAFGAKPLLFGHMFMMVLAVRVFFRDILKLGDILEVLEEIRAIQHFSVQNSSHKPAVVKEKLEDIDTPDK